MRRHDPLRATAVAILASIFSIGCGSGQTSTRCSQDSDCRPATCCHATACVAAAEGPRCADVACSAECAPGTIDCGGGCVCQNGACAAHIVR